MLERENQKLANENLVLKIENRNMKAMKFQGNQAAHNQNGNKKVSIAMAGMKTPIAYQRSQPTVHMLPRKQHPRHLLWKKTKFGKSKG